MIYWSCVSSTSVRTRHIRLQLLGRGRQPGLLGLLFHRVPDGGGLDTPALLRLNSDKG